VSGAGGAVGVASVEPLTAPPNAVVRVPGSKSITNRALLCAALADGVSVLRGVLVAQDTEAMMAGVEALGATLEVDNSDPSTLTVTGAGTRVASVPTRIDARQSGTTSRFMLAAVALGDVEHVVDGEPQLQTRPFAPLVDALVQLGVSVRALGVAGHLPLAVRGPARGGAVSIPGHLSSQFLSGLMLAAPLMARGLDVELSSPLVSVPYVAMTRAVMAAFGVEVDGLRVPPGAYRAREFAIEPDASAASYFFAAAAISGGRVTVEGLGTESIQGDVAFVDILEQMGAVVRRTADAITVTGGPVLHGVDIDMADISDTAQTLAAVAVFADGPTRVRGIGFIRGKETDRIAAIVNELRRAGVGAEAHDDGFTVVPGPVAPTRFETYDDHRMAMSLALLGLRVPGVELANPGCVAKTYPGFFNDLAGLRS
jgi:3-phosphoshikimate 1-carboxyvinyltransferase